MAKDTGGPAFPRARSADPEEFHKPETYHAQEGATLRDYFATHALNGILADHVSRLTRQEALLSPDLVAKACYDYADAMIAERTK